MDIIVTQFDDQGVEIPLTRGLYALVDVDIAEEVVRKRWHAHNTGYAVRSTYCQGSYEVVSMHRFIWELSKGPIPEDMQIDHINGKRTDNRLSNLRLVTYRGNAANKACHRDETCTSHLIGVSWHKKFGKWRSSLSIGYTSYHLGLYTTEEDAHEAYQIAVRNYEQTGELPKPRSMSSQYKGVSWHKQHEKWAATMYINRTLYHLGYYDIEEEAAQAYITAKHGYDTMGMLPAKAKRKKRSVE